MVCRLLFYVVRVFDRGSRKKTLRLSYISFARVRHFVDSAIASLTTASLFFVVVFAFCRCFNRGLSNYRFDFVKSVLLQTVFSSTVLVFCLRTLFRISDNFLACPCFFFVARGCILIDFAKVFLRIQCFCFLLVFSFLLRGDSKNAKNANLKFST